MNPKKSRRGSWWFTAPLAASAVAYLIFLWMPGYLAIRAAQDKLKSHRQAVAQSAELSTALAASERELKKVQSVVAQWENASPRPHGLLGFLEKINALARAAGLTIDRFDPQPIVAHEKTQELPLAIDCSGEFAQVYEFLRSVERLTPAIWVNSVQLAQTAQGVNRLRCEANLTIFSQNPLGDEGEASPDTAVGDAASGQPSWQDVVSWRRNDPRTKIAPPLADKRNPFSAPGR